MSELASVEKRFSRKVDKSSECWLWTGSRDCHGYGQFRLEGKTRGSHRVAFELTHGPIVGAMDVDHLCHTPACVRPSHLRLASRKENSEHRSGPNANSRSGVLGVSWNARKQRWRARVHHHGKEYFAGYFTEISAAEVAVIAKRNELFTRNDLDRTNAMKLRNHDHTLLCGEEGAIDYDTLDAERDTRAADDADAARKEYGF